MASGPHWDKNRGTYRVQFFDGHRWRRPTVYKVPGWKPGQPKPKKVPPEAQAAVQLYADRERAARSSRPIDPGLTLADFLSGYRAVYAGEREATSLLQLDYAIRAVIAWAASAKVARLDEMTAGACQRFLDWRARQISRKTGRPISPARLSQERALLSGAWARPVRLGEMAANPWKSTITPGWAKDRKRKKDRPSWSPEQFDRLVAAGRPWLRDMLVLGTQTGLRITALCALEWRDIAWGEEGFGTLTVRPELDKAGRGYSLPLTRKAHDLLFRLRIHRDDSPLVLRTASGGPLRPSATGKAIRRTCRKAGLPDPKSPNHHCRRTFGRWAALGDLVKGKPIPLFVVMKWLGHSSINTTMIYLDLSDDESRDWMAELEPQP